MKNILFVAFESLPFIKTGGLADVIYSLPKSLDKDEFDVKVALPLLGKIKDKYFDGMEYVDRIEVHCGYINEEANVYTLNNEGVEYIFIENQNYFERPDVYGYGDDVSRFSFFSLAVLEMIRKTGYYPDLIHTHDYHTAVIPALCKLRYSFDEGIRRIKHVFTIHNLVYQGQYDKQVLFDLLGFDYLDYINGSLRYNDGCNFMKIGIEFADAVTTVSETYALEIQGAELGEGLDTMLRYRADDLYGIVNGIDTDSFNPETDKIAANYNIDTYKEGKAACKAALQRELGLNEDPNALLVGMVSRLTFQKGVDIFTQSLDELLSLGVQVAVLGTGESSLEYTLKIAEENHKGQLAFYCGYNEALAHSIYAGIDMLLMPSKFEPCGISQLISMRYGTLPLVRETGGLKDTVLPFNEYTGEGRGFSFGPYSKYDFVKVFEYANTQYKFYPERWDNLVRNAMSYDVSFAASARKYEDLYNKLIG